MLKKRDSKAALRFSLPLALWFLALPSFAARVRVSVEGSDPTLSIVKSYLLRDLRKLNDVQIVEADPEFQLSVLISEVRNAGQGNLHGYILSVVGSTVWAKSSMERLASGVTKECWAYKYVFEGMTGTGRVVQHSLQQGSKADLEFMCSEAVALFDTQALEPDRKRSQDLWERIKHLGEQPPNNAEKKQP